MPNSRETTDPTPTPAHTPGPWIAEESEPRGWYIKSEQGGVMPGVVHGEHHDPCAHANARLIAAAPKLVEALENLERAASELSGHKGTSRKGPRTSADWSRLHTRIAEARTALTAATGEGDTNDDN